MKILGLVGSPRTDGNTDKAVQNILDAAQEKNAAAAKYNINELDMQGCQSCFECKYSGKCAVNDDMQTIYREIEDSDVVVVGSPVYMWQMSSQTKKVVDRFFRYFKSPSEDKIKNKKVILVFTQNNPDLEFFKDYTAKTKEMYEFLGFNVVDTLIFSANSDFENAKNAVENLG